jgi:hypothetical protein
MAIDETPDPYEKEWIVVCVDCGRIKRANEWTDEKALPLPAGTSTGFCPECFATRRRTY